MMVLGNALEQMERLFDHFLVQNFDNSLFTMMSSHRSPSGSSRYHAQDLSCCAKYYFPYIWVVPSLWDNFLVLRFKSCGALQAPSIRASVGTVAGVLYPD